MSVIGNRYFLVLQSVGVGGSGRRTRQNRTYYGFMHIHLSWSAGAFLKQEAYNFRLFCETIDTCHVRNFDVLPHAPSIAVSYVN